MSNWMELVYEYAPDYFEEYKKLYCEHTLTVGKMNWIRAKAATKAQLRFAPEIWYLKFTYMDNASIEPNFPVYNEKFEYRSFTIDACKLYDITREHIIEYMKDGVMPRPNTMVIGKELQDCVVHGFLPKRFRTHIMDFDLRYDSGISGVMFLE